MWKPRLCAGLVGLLGLTGAFGAAAATLRLPDVDLLHFHLSNLAVDSANPKSIACVVKDMAGQTENLQITAFLYERNQADPVQAASSWPIIDTNNPVMCDLYFTADIDPAALDHIDLQVVSSPKPERGQQTGIKPAIGP